jgi:hypothetical protein
MGNPRRFRKSVSRIVMSSIMFNVRRLILLTNAASPLPPRISSQCGAGYLYIICLYHDRQTRCDFQRRLITLHWNRVGSIQLPDRLAHQYHYLHRTERSVVPRESTHITMIGTIPIRRCRMRPGARHLMKYLGTSGNSSSFGSIAIAARGQALFSGACTAGIRSRRLSVGAREEISAYHGEARTQLESRLQPRGPARKKSRKVEKSWAGRDTSANNSWSIRTP